MIPGFNHNVKYGGQVYHIQTEDNGLDNPYVITHIFLNGNVVTTRRTSYLDIVSNENVGQVIRSMMKQQHKAVMKDLINGTFDDLEAITGKPEIKPPPPGSGPATKVTPDLDLDKAKDEEKSLDEIILEYLSKESK